MTKIIKFNLIIDGNPVRDLNGLRENFNVDDILNYYRNGLLIKWLASRGYTEELSNITAISSEDNLDIISEIADIFRVNIETHQAEELLYLFDCRKEWNASLSQLDKCNFQHQDVIKNYCAGYDSLLKGILNDKDNMALIKSSMKQISENYIDVFRYHLPSFCDEFIEKSPLAIFALLINPTLRKLFLDFDLISEKIRKLIPEISYESLDSSNIEKLKNDSLFHQGFQGNTKGNWRVIQPNDIKCLVIDLTDKDNVMVAHHTTAKIKFKREPAIGKILNGLQFYSCDFSDFVKYVPINSCIDSEIIIRKLFHLAGSHLKKRNLDTKEYWEDIEPKGKKFMIIGMREGNFVRNAGNQGEILSAEDVNGKFLILDGIDYKSNNSEHEIGYLEV